MKLTDALNNLGPLPAFESRPVYSAAGDCLTHYFENTESYADRIDALLTVYRSFETEDIIGFEIKGVRQLLERSGEFGMRFDPVHLSLLFLVSNVETRDGQYPEGERKAVYRQLAERSRDTLLDARELVAV